MIEPAWFDFYENEDEYDEELEDEDDESEEE